VSSEVIPPIILKWLIERIFDREIIPELERITIGDEFQKLGNEVLYEVIGENPEYKRILNCLRERGVFEVEDATELNKEQVCSVFSGEDKDICLDFLESLSEKYIEEIRKLGNEELLARFSEISSDQQIEWDFSKIEPIIRKRVKEKNESVLSSVIRLLKKEISLEDFNGLWNQDDFFS
jgi:hypothetical protein